MTSVPGVLLVNCGRDPEVCFFNPNASKEIFTLGAGDHSFTIKTLLSPFSLGEAYLCIDSGLGNCGVGPIDDNTDVPEPTSMFLLGLGLLGGFLWVKLPRLTEVIVRIARKRQRR